MTATNVLGHPLGTVRRARWLLVALHLPTMALAPTNAIIGNYSGHPGNALVAALTALSIGGLQLRHSFAAARGERPRAWQWTGLALIVLAYLPIVWFTWDWQTMQWFVIASALMLLRPRVAMPLVAAILLSYATVNLLSLVYVDHEGPASVITFVVYASTSMFVGGVGLYGAARLVRALDELHATRAELAELAVGRERLRVSRDLHDLLGHSLSAVSLKGDLAMRLLCSDPPAARAEIASLTQVARDALHGVRAVTRDEHVVSLSTETDGAAALLRAAGIDAHIDVHMPGLPRQVEDVLAWAVREGVTNLLRHSDARTCSIVARCHDGIARLEIANDGVRSKDVEATSEGSGLAGLTERASTVAGLVSANCTADGRFEVLVTIPHDVA